MCPCTHRCIFLPRMRISSHIRSLRAEGKPMRRMNIPAWAWDALVAEGWD